MGKSHTLVTDGGLYQSRDLGGERHGGGPVKNTWSEDKQPSLNLKDKNLIGWKEEKGHLE